MSCDLDIWLARLEAIIPSGETRQKRMFGGVCFMRDEHMMLCVSQKKGLMVRVGPEAQAELLQYDHTAVMIMNGRPMKGFIWVKPDGLESQEQLSFWVDKARDFVITLPPKSEKPKSKKGKIYE